MSARERRILHLADPTWPGGGPCALRLLATATRRLTHDRHVTVVLGNADAARTAARCGVEHAGHVPMPGGIAPLARRAVGRAATALAGEFGRFDVVHAWSSRAALLCDVVAGAAPVATCATAPVEGAHAELLGALMAHRPMPLLAATVSVRRELLALGVDPDHVHVLPPGVAAARDHGERRERLRERWGVGPDDFVMGLVGDPVEWTDARGAVFVLTLLRVAGHRAHLVLHPDASRAAHMARWASPLRIDAHVTLDPAIARPWTTAPGLDIALSLGDETTAIEPRALGSPFSLLLGGGRPSRPMAGVLPLLWMAAAGVPALAEASLAACGVVEEGVTGLLVEPRHVESAARRLLAALEDPQLRGRLGHAARERVAHTHPVSAMTVRLREVYDCLTAGQPLPAALAGIAPDDDSTIVRWTPTTEGPRGLQPRTRGIRGGARDGAQAT